MNLAELGWNPHFNQHFESCSGGGLSPALVAREEKNAYLVLCEHGELAAEICGKLRHEARSRGDLPAVGDWVAVSARPEEGKATIRAVLPRKSRVVRAGGQCRQPLVGRQIGLGRAAEIEAHPVEQRRVIQRVGRQQFGVALTSGALQCRPATRGWVG